MKNWTIGKRIKIGFVLVLTVMCAVGFFAAYNMKRAATSAKAIATESVPENIIGARLSSSFGIARVAARDYVLTYDATYLDKALKAFADMNTTFAEAHTLVQEHPELTQLAAGLKEAEPAAREDADLVVKMQTTGASYIAARAAAAQIAIDLNTALAKIVAEERLHYETEATNPSTSATKLTSLFATYQRVSELQLEANLARVSNWKAQTFHDVTMLDACLAQLAKMEQAAGELAPLVTTTAGKAEMATCTQLLGTYQKTIGDLKSAFVAFAENSDRRTAVGITTDKYIQEILAGSSVRAQQSAALSSVRLAGTTGWVFGGMVAASVLGIIIALVITRATNGVLSRLAAALNNGSDQVASAAQQVSSSSQSLAEGSSEQAASIEETGSSLEELSSMTKRNADHSQQANDLSRQTRVVAEKGVADMQDMNTAMKAIKESSDDVAKIIKTIDEIAFQTNILALNAAVEAARAGEAGMGFAVVADEVRNLAQRSAQAAKETATKIEGAITKTAQGVDLSGKVTATLNDIVTKARQVDELAAEVAGASREQTQGITQINTAVGQMDKVTQSNAANAEESAAAAEELSSQAQLMKQSVAELLELVGGKAESAARQPAVSASKPVRKAEPAVQRRAVTKEIPVPAPEKSRRSEIPMEADFKDF